MLNKLDDFPIHQTSEPIAVPATSDRNVYDRTWFNGYARDGSYYFGIGMAIYPDDADDAVSLLRAADNAMYLGKRQGGNEVIVFTRRNDAVSSN